VIALEQAGAKPRRPHRRIPFADQLRRRRELDEIRMQRPLTAAERVEDDDLAQRFAQRVWRAQCASPRR
jgi:hypothetical protein